MFAGRNYFSSTGHCEHGKEEEAGKIGNIYINCQVNLLSVVLNDAPILPEEDDEDVASLLKDSPQCMAFGLFMIW